MPRILPFGLTAAVAALAAVPSPATAARGQAPWCAVMQVGWDNVVTDCSFWTLEQCVPYVIAGNRGFCQQNPSYTGPIKRKRASRSGRR